ncbi:hypothetical protein ACM55G_14405, partial [Flavobacterium sp. LB3P122]|uniref:hypothetical protein n=1 Tax=Flavobacterium algoriphilum TaxID=3398738 RepID=UPI003A8C3728
MKSKITFLLAFLIFVGNVNSYSNGVKIDPPKVSTLSNRTVQCNIEVPTSLVTGAFDNLTTSSSTCGLCLSCGISNEARLTDLSLTNFATASTLSRLDVTHYLRVTDINDTFAVGNFANYRIAPSRGLSLTLLNNNNNNNNNNETGVWTIDNLNNGANTSLTKTTTVTGNEPDPNLSNNTSTTTANIIIANDDTGSPVNGGIGGVAFINVLDNDTLNGLPFLPVQVNTTFVSSTNAGVTLSGTNVIVAANTPAGTYSLIYQICEVLNPANCDLATVSVTVFCGQAAAVTLIQPTCLLPTGTLTVTAPIGVGLTYSIDGINYQ